MPSVTCIPVVGMASIMLSVTCIQVVGMARIKAITQVRPTILRACCLEVNCSNLVMSKSKEEIEEWPIEALRSACIYCTVHSTLLYNQLQSTVVISKLGEEIDE